MNRLCLSFFSLLVLITGCKSEYTSYDLAYLNTSGLKAIGKIVDTYEQGEFEYLVDKTLIKKGKYDRGQKIGIWEYYLGSDLYSIDWKIYSRKDDSLSISIPSIWKYYEADNRLFLADVTPEIKNDKKKLFALLHHNLANRDTSIDELAGSFYSTTKEVFNITSREIYKIDTDGQSYYYFKMGSNLNGENYLIFTLLFKRNNYLYEISLIHDTERARIKEILFFDIIYGTFINNKRIISPYHMFEIKSVREPSSI